MVVGGNLWATASNLKMVELPQPVCHIISPTGTFLHVGLELSSLNIPELCGSHVHSPVRCVGGTKLQWEKHLSATLSIAKKCQPASKHKSTLSLSLLFSLELPGIGELPDTARYCHRIP